MSSPILQPVPPEPYVLEQIAKSAYFQHLVEAQTDARMEAKVRAATHDFLSVRYRVLLGGLASILSVAGWFGFNSWTRFDKEIQAIATHRSEVEKIKAEVDKMHKGMGEQAKDVDRVIKEEIEKAKSASSAASEQARLVLSGYLADTRALNAEQKTALREGTRAINTQVAATDNTLSDVTKLKREAEQKLESLETRLRKANEELAAKQNSLNSLIAQASEKEALLRNLEQYTAAATSELVALRSRSMQTVTMANPRNPAETYQMTFVSKGLTPPVALKVKVSARGGSVKECEVLNAGRGGARICDTPFEAAEAFTYHTIFSPDFMVFRVKVSNAWLAEQRQKLTASR